MLGLSTTTAAALLTGHTLVAKSLMTVLFRAKITAKATAKQEVDKVCASEFYKRVHAAQLNEARPFFYCARESDANRFDVLPAECAAIIGPLSQAEYAPLLIGGLLYLSLKGVEAPVLCTLSVVGQVRGALGGHSRYVKGTPRLSCQLSTHSPVAVLPVGDLFATRLQVWYYWLRAFVGHSHEGGAQKPPRIKREESRKLTLSFCNVCLRPAAAGIDPPPYVPGALMRYAALGMLAYNIYKTG